MKDVREVVTDAGRSFFVEVDGSAVITGKIVSSETPSDLPPGAEPTSVGESIQNVAVLLRENIISIASLVKDSLAEVEPKEWTLELNVGFVGKTNIVPILVSTQANATLKVIVKWAR